MDWLGQLLVGWTLKIEVNVMPGKGAVQVAGSLGNVMKSLHRRQSVISEARVENIRSNRISLKNMIYIFIFQKEPCQKTDHLLELR